MTLRAWYASLKGVSFVFVFKLFIKAQILRKPLKDLEGLEDPLRSPQISLWGPYKALKNPRVSFQVLQILSKALNLNEKLEKQKLKNLVKAKHPPSQDRESEIMWL